MSTEQVPACSCSRCQQLVAVDLGQLAYEAYRIGAGGRSLATGDTLPDWPDLPAEIREAWRASADGVRMFLESLG